MLKLHLDTDIGGDIDDLCALAMLLNWPDAELLSVTVETSLRRAYLPTLRQSGPLAQLIARQAEAFAKDENFEQGRLLGWYGYFLIDARC